MAGPQVCVSAVGGSRRGGLRPGAATPEFVAQSAARLLPCLPATGAGLPPLAAQLGLEVDRG